jgi:enoyl-CoA hydratase/carnithine racemase
MAGDDAKKSSADLELRGQIALVWLDRPEVINAIDPKMLAALNAIFDRIEADDDIRVMVVAGRGPRGFCSGADLATVANLVDASKRRFIESAWQTIDRIAQLPVPTVAALHGHVLGGGLEIALACDLRLADPQTKLGLPEMQLGSVPSFGAVQRLPELIGRARALELLLGGARIDSVEAENMGLVTAVSAPGDVLGAALSRAEALAGLEREAMRFLRTALECPAGAGKEAAALHGMISDLCHRRPAYQERIARFGQNAPQDHTERT